jgi:hypothetical protein
MAPNKRSGSRFNHAFGLCDPAPRLRIATLLLLLLLLLLPSCFARCSSSAWLQRNRGNAQQLGRLLISARQELPL